MHCHTLGGFDDGCHAFGFADLLSFFHSLIICGPVFVPFLPVFNSLINTWSEIYERQYAA